MIDYSDGPHHFGIDISSPKNNEDILAYNAIHAYITLALIYANDGDYVRYVETLTKANDLYPNVVVLDYLWQHFHNNDGEREALTVARQMIRQSPPCYLGYLRKAQSLNCLQQYRAALSATGKALQCADLVHHVNCNNIYHVQAVAHLGYGDTNATSVDWDLYREYGYGCTCGDIFPFNSVHFDL